MLELGPEFQNDPSSLSLLYFKGNGPLVPLETLATAKQQIGPQTVNHYGQLTSANHLVWPGAGRGARGVLSQVKDVADHALPEGVSGQFQGAAKAFQGALSNLAILLVIAVLVVYIVLRDPLRELHPPVDHSVRSAVGRLRRARHAHRLPDRSEHLRLCRHDHAHRHRREKTQSCRSTSRSKAERRGMSSEQAIYQGCLNPIPAHHVTTLAAMLGAVPIAVGYGAGGEARRPLGLVVVGGLLFSQLVTLYLTPVFFIYMAQLPDLAEDSPGGAGPAGRL